MKVQSLRILHVTPYSAEAWAYGGIPRVADALTRGLARLGHQVTVCTTDVCDAENRLPWPSVQPQRRDGVEIHVFPNFSNHLAYRWQAFLPRGLGRYLLEHASSFDVAHLHACRNLPGAIAARHLHRAGVPYVVAPNGTAPIIERRRLAKHLFDAVIGDGTMRAAARFVAVTSAEQRQLVQLGVDPDSIRLVPNPIDLEEFSSPVARGAFRARSGLGARTLVLFLGKVTPRKRLDVLIRALAETRRTDATLAIAGNDMGGVTQARELARSIGVGDRVLFTGLLRGRERLEALADADVVVYPSEQEIFGLVPLESLLVGTPVIVSDDSGCGEVIRSVGGGMVVPVGDVSALARATERVLDALERYRMEAGDAAVKVRSMFGADQVCGQLSAVYDELVRH